MDNGSVLTGLEKALEHSGGTHTLQDVRDLVAAGKAQYWTEGNAVIITELREEPQMRVLHFWLTTGELEDVMTLSERIIEWGRSIGCKRATLAGRKGWVKALAPAWKPELVLMGRDISDGQGKQQHDNADHGPRQEEPTVR